MMKDDLLKQANTIKNKITRLEKQRSLIEKCGYIKIYPGTMGYHPTEEVKDLSESSLKAIQKIMISDISCQLIEAEREFENL